MSSGKHTGSSLLASYAAGFAAAFVLTGIAFGAVVYEGPLPAAYRAGAVLLAGIAQILVHLRFFLHLDLRSAARWNLVSFLFATVIIIIFVWGTIWVMTDLNFRMM